MVYRGKPLKIYRWLKGKGYNAMTILPAKHQKRIMKLIKPGRRTPKEAPIDITDKPLTRENEYFTFNKFGELINVDDDEVLALEREISENWRRDFLASVEQDGHDS